MTGGEAGKEEQQTKKKKKKEKKVFLLFNHVEAVDAPTHTHTR